MKRLILSVVIIFYAHPSFGQTGGLNILDPSSSSPSGLSGAMGGGSTPSTPSSRSTTPYSVTPQTQGGFGTLNEQQQVEDSTNYFGGSQDGDLDNNTIIPPASIPGASTPETALPLSPPTAPTNIPRSSTTGGSGPSSL
ncbi:MAG: hypothetical protein NDI69_14495 [Bacteriovoracaceae bacterium]|nr:hypothetical protein [Bacteriovoracaceae bacterium]